MAAPLSMEIYNERLASFETARPPAKKRGSNTKGNKSSKWPHRSPTPVQLAEAGFFFAPTTSCPDNTTCFLCGKHVDGWEENDDPVKEHLTFSPNCGWAVNKAIELALENGTYRNPDPMSVEMLEARRSTFLDKWPHEGKRGWTCKIQKMIEAGWYYCPTSESDDFVKCPFCSLSLDGWEPKDKPYEEHQRRSPDCAFFSHAVSTNTKPNKSKKGRMSKASRASIQSTITTGIEEQSMLGAPIEDGDTIVLDATTLTIDSTVSKKAAKKGSKGKSARSKVLKSVKAVIDIPLQGSSFVEPEDDDFEVKVVQSPAARRGKKRLSDEMEVDAPDDLADTQTAKRRTTRGQRSNAPQQTVPDFDVLDQDKEDIPMTDAEDIAPTGLPMSKKGAKNGRKRASSNTRKASAMSMASKASLRDIPPDEALDAALAEDLDRPLTDDEPEGPEKDAPEVKPRRRLTRTRPGSKKTTASVAPVRRATRTSTAQTETAPFEVRVNSRRTSLEDNTHEPVNDHIEIQPLVNEPVKTAPGKKTRKMKGSKQPTALSEDKFNNDSQQLAKNSKNHDLDAMEDKIGDDHQIQEVEPEISIPLDAAPPVDDSDGRQSSQRLSAIKQKASAIEMFQPVDYSRIDLEISVLTATVADDDTGHETDASTVSHAAVKRGGRKAAPPKKGKRSKKVQAPPQSIEDIIKISLPVIGKVDIEAPVAAASDKNTSIEPRNEIGDVASKRAVNKGTSIGRNMAASSSLEDSEHRSRGPAPAVPIGTGTPTKLVKYTSKSSTTAVPKHIASSPAHAAPSPAGSLQSSDAENQPPSTRPSQQRPPLFEASPSRPRVLFAAITPNLSPSRQKLGGKLQSTFPWKPVDLENIFLGSPEKEDTPILEGMTFDLTSPEKSMTVEEWIKFNAERGAERLRNDCERLVGRFEGEGNRALKALEGIVCQE